MGKRKKHKPPTGWQAKRSMDAKEYKEIREGLRLSMAEAGRFLGVSPRTARRYAYGEVPIPTAAVLLIRAVLAYNIKIEVPPASGPWW